MSFDDLRPFIEATALRRDGDANRARLPRPDAADLPAPSGSSRPADLTPG